MDFDGNKLIIGGPELLLDIEPQETTSFRYSPAPGGQRFLIVEPADGAKTEPLVVELNWTRRLQR